VTTTTRLDGAEVERFAEQAVGDFSGMMTVALCHLGDRLGLFRDLAANGPATAAELADRTGIDERYAAEWLRGLAAPGYLGHDDGTGRYELSPEHALVLATEGSPAFLGGGYQMFGAMLEPLGAVAVAFRDGGGAAQAEYAAEWWEGMERFTNAWFESFMLQEWIPAMPEVEAKLEAGCDYADVGCGSGRALIRLAQRFPASRFVGYDLFPIQAERAAANIDAAGLAGRVRVEVADAALGLPEAYDVISTYDVVHDAVDPVGLLRGIRGALRPGGHYVCLDVNCADRHEDNRGPLAAIFYGFSVLYCMTTSLAGGGAGLGACGLPEAKVRELCGEAGFAEVRRVPVENPFNTLYEARR
jgi:SAM-dependent methyltransferase